MKKEKIFNFLSRQEKQEILRNPAYARILGREENKKKLKFKKDRKGDWYITNYLEIF